MATMEPKDPQKNESFFRKVVRFVANPTTEWADLNTLQRESVDADLAKTELKAMIERKRRNDFVRKREFDMLRKIRREGLTGERLAGLEGLSRLEDSQLRSQDSGSRIDNGVKAKIDAIEQQMVGDSLRSSLPAAPPAQRRGAAVMRSTAPAPLNNESFFNATTSPQVMRDAMPGEMFRPTGPMEEHLPMDADAMSLAPTEVAPLYGLPAESGAGESLLSRSSVSGSMAGPLSSGSGSIHGANTRVSALSPLYNVGEQSQAGAVEVTELAHDPDLDEAVIAFANADFDQCERLLTNLVSDHGSRSQHSETWLALFDLYRAIGQQAKFEAQALDYVHRFGWSAPQWYSLPKLVADAAALGEHARPASPSSRSENTIGWVGPAMLDTDTIAELRSQLLQMPLPWVLDWRGVRHIDAQACTALTQLLRDWAGEPIEMRWIGGEGFFNLLGDLAPTGVKDADPAIWMLRLEALRLANRVVDFDQVAIDYCLTYEVSPPSWESAKCTLRMSSGTGVTVAPITHIAEVASTMFHESQPHDDDAAVAALELSGQLVGDISGTLKSLDARIGAATLVQVSCARLIRLDFLAAGDLLNWVLSKRGENRSVQFIDAHRLVALFCGAMGINEHARVTVRNH